MAIGRNYRNKSRRKEERPGRVINRSDQNEQKETIGVRRRTNRIFEIVPFNWKKKKNGQSRRRVLRHPWTRDKTIRPKGSPPSSNSHQTPHIERINKPINQKAKKIKNFPTEQKVSEWRDTWMRGGGSTVVTWETGSSTTMITAAVHKWSSSAILSLVVLWLSTCSSGSSVYSTDIGNKIWCRDATFTSSPVIFLWDSPPRYWTRNSTCLATIYYASWVPVK